MREIVTCTDVQQKKPVSIFVNGQFVLCIHVHNFKSFCNSKSHLQVFTWWWVSVYLYCGVSYESVYVCVVVSLRPVCFSICKFWQILINLAIPICTYLILNIFCSPVVSMKSHLSLRTNTNVLTLFLITVFGEGKWRHYLYCMYLILFTYVYNTEISCTNGSYISHGNFFHCYINLCFRDKLYMYM